MISGIKVRKQEIALAWLVGSLEWLDPIFFGCHLLITDLSTTLKRGINRPTHFHTWARASFITDGYFLLNMACNLKGSVCSMTKDLSTLRALHNSCNMYTHVLPDMYTLSPWAWPSGFRCTYQTNYSCPCYNYNLCTTLTSLRSMKTPEIYMRISNMP